MPLLWCDMAEQTDHNRCWRCGGYDWCSTPAHDEALRNFILYASPLSLVVDIGILLALLKLAGVL